MLPVKNYRMVSVFAVKFFVQATMVFCPSWLAFVIDAKFQSKNKIPFTFQNSFKFFVSIISQVQNFKTVPMHGNNTWKKLFSAISAI